MKIHKRRKCLSCLERQTSRWIFPFTYVKIKTFLSVKFNVSIKLHRFILISTTYNTIELQVVIVVSFSVWGLLFSKCSFLFGFTQSDLICFPGSTFCSRYTTHSYCICVKFDTSAMATRSWKTVGYDLESLCAGVIPKFNTGINKHQFGTWPHVQMLLLFVSHYEK